MISFINSFEEISKNQGISFLSLDPTESYMQLFHHGTIIGGSWDSPSKQLVSVLGFDSDAKPIQIVQKSIKDIKTKSHSVEELAIGLQTLDSFEQLKNPKLELHYKNIVPIPHLLTKTFMELPNTDPYSVAKAFFDKMYQYDSQLNEAQSVPDLSDETAVDDKSSSDSMNDIDQNLKPSTWEAKPSEFLQEFIHVIQFCHLCAKGKIPPVLYSLATNLDIQNWFSTLKLKTMPIPRHGPKRTAMDTPTTDDEIAFSPEQKLSRKDHYLIHTMLKLHESIDKNTLKQTQEKDEKEPGFHRLELHIKNLILNASATPPFDTQAPTPTEFYSTFLSKKSQFKAKEMILHRFHLNKIAFNPSTYFIANLWHGDFFWLLPDAPSGVSIFYCPETKSLNAAELEREKNYALADKVKPGDIEKLSKQRLYLPTSIMDMVWMAQNFLAVISLCFGSQSLSASFLKDWADHMYENRLMYSSLQASDPTFFAKVLFAIDNALQIHWRSCSSTQDRLSVNDRILLMSETQESILRHNFIQQIPKLLSDKVLATQEGLKDRTNGFIKPGGKQANGQDLIKGKPEIITDTDKNHKIWHVKHGEDFTKIFYKNQKQCPKTNDGKTICMKFFIRGFCDKSCSRVHKLNQEEEKEFDKFVFQCREGATKPDF
jgi:hypothetical protein